MNLRRRLLDRIQFWTADTAPLDHPDADPADKHARIVRCIEKSTLPHGIRFAGDGYELLLSAAHGTLLSAKLSIDGSAPKDFEFSSGDSTAQITEFNIALSRLAELYKGEAPEFSPALVKKGAKGIFANQLEFIEGDLSAAELDLAENSQEEVASTPPSFERKPDFPKEFLEANQRYSEYAILLTQEAAADPDLEGLADKIGDDTAFESLNDWQKKLASKLGEPIVAINLPSDPHQNCTAFAFSGDKGVGIEFPKRFLSQVCRSAVSD